MAQNPLESFFSSLFASSDGNNNDNKNGNNGLVEIVADNAHIRHIPEHDILNDEILPPHMATRREYSSSASSSRRPSQSSVPVYPSPFLKRASRWDAIEGEHHLISNNKKEKKRKERRSSSIIIVNNSPNSDISLNVPSRRRSVDDIILDDCAIFRDKSSSTRTSTLSSSSSSSSESCTDSFRSRRWRENESFHCRRMSKLIEELPLDDTDDDDDDDDVIRRKGTPTTIRTILLSQHGQPPEAPARQSSIMDFDIDSLRSQLCNSERQLIDKWQPRPGSGSGNSTRGSVLRNKKLFPPTTPTRRSSILDIDVSAIMKKAIGMFQTTTSSTTTTTNRGNGKEEADGSRRSVVTPPRMERSAPHASSSSTMMSSFHDIVTSPLRRGGARGAI